MPLPKILDEITHTHTKRVNANFVITSTAQKFAPKYAFSIGLVKFHINMDQM